MKIIFMGTPDFAWSILKTLLEDNETEVAGVFTQPDKPAGRKKELTAPYVKRELIKKYSSVPLFQPNSLKDDKIKDTIRSLKPDFIVVAAYGQILDREVLNIAPCINLHASILPRYRGASPIQSTILNADSYAGVTAMLMNEALDEGDMLGYRFVKMKKDTSVEELFIMLSDESSKLILSILKNFKHIRPIKQYDALASYCKKIKKIDGEVDFDDAEELYVKFRALHPWPGIFLKNGLKIKKLKPFNVTSTGRKGEILHIEDDFVRISCVRGEVDIYRVQPSSKREMSAKEYIVGKRLKIGDNFF